MVEREQNAIEQFGIDTERLPTRIEVLRHGLRTDETAVDIEPPTTGRLESQCRFSETTQKAASMGRRAEPGLKLAPIRVVDARRQVSAFVEVWNHDTTL